MDGPGVYDGLDSSSTFDALSANQGRILYGMINDLSTLIDTTIGNLEELLDTI